MTWQSPEPASINVLSPARHRRRRVGARLPDETNLCRVIVRPVRLRGEQRLERFPILALFARCFQRFHDLVRALMERCVADRQPDPVRIRGLIFFTTVKRRARFTCRVQELDYVHFRVGRSEHGGVETHERRRVHSHCVRGLLNLFGVIQEGADHEHDQQQDGGADEKRLAIHSLAWKCAAASST